MITQCKGKNVMEQSYQPTLIQPDNLIEHLDQWNGKIIDCRGRNEYEKSHIPGAMSVPANLLQDPDSERGQLYSWDKVKSLLMSWGVGSEGPWLLYDDAGFVAAGRVFWVLEYFGVKDLAVLDGGWMIWTKNKYPTSNQLVKPKQGIFNTPVNYRVLAEKADVLKVLEFNGIVDRQGKPLSETILLDTRTLEEYQGTKITAERNGHIPGAIHCNWENNIVDLFTPVFKPLDTLSEYYKDLEVTSDKEVIVYCRTGSRSCQTYLTLKLLGFKGVRNYVGSWLDWGNDSEVPVEC
jgi:thiosulfate/3-mercaptopyruvate sulfurtransferase